jgi:hypothetical protein
MWCRRRRCPKSTGVSIVGDKRNDRKGTNGKDQQQPCENFHLFLADQLLIADFISSAWERAWRNFLKPFFNCFNSRRIRQRNIAFLANSGQFENLTEIMLPYTPTTHIASNEFFGGTPGKND